MSDEGRREGSTDLYSDLARTWGISHPEAKKRILEHAYKVSFDPVRDVDEFHRKFNLQYEGKPRSLEGHLQQFRVDFMREELREYEDAVFALQFDLGQKDLNQEHVVEYLEQALDALVDLMYVTIGAAHLHGFNLREAWRRVHEKNMQKVRGPSKRSQEFDVVKPPGWTPPSHRDLVEDNAHVGQ